MRLLGLAVRQVTGGKEEVELVDLDVSFRSVGSIQDEAAAAVVANKRLREADVALILVKHDGGIGVALTVCDGCLPGEDHDGGDAG